MRDQGIEWNPFPSSFCLDLVVTKKVEETTGGIGGEPTPWVGYTTDGANHYQSHFFERRRTTTEETKESEEGGVNKGLGTRIESFPLLFPF